MRTLYSPACCKDYGPAVPEQYNCFWKDIKRDYTKLYCRYRKMVTNNQRIWELAEPRTRTPKYEKICACPDRGVRKTTIVNMEQPMHTRLEQLSYPPVRNLSLLKEHSVYRNFSTPRKSNVNRMMHKSLLSLYSRLSNVQPPVEKERPKKWTEQEWEKHRARLEELAKPRKDPSIQEEEEAMETKRMGPKCCGGGGKRFPYEIPKTTSMKRISRLAKPKTYVELCRPAWELTPAVAKYQPSKRVLQMSRPNKVHIIPDLEEPYRVQEAALNYKITDRVKFLAMPTKINIRNTVVEQQRNQVSPAALKFKTKKRYFELSEPKMFADNHTRKDPYKVSPKALKAKTTKRIIELSQPRKYGLGLTRT